MRTFSTNAGSPARLHCSRSNAATIQFAALREHHFAIESFLRKGRGNVWVSLRSLCRVRRLGEGPDKIIQNGSVKGLFMAAAVQEMEFKLDRHGAEIFSSAYVSPADGGPKELHFNRPFLISMKKRDAARPFFVMWVDNAELLRPGKAGTPPAK
jgi:hypothetical protein